MREIKARDIPGGFDIGLVVSRYNSDITELMLQQALTRLEQLECAEERVITVHVPGVTEIVAAAHEMIKHQKLDVIVAIGCVISGETPYSGNLCQDVMSGCRHLSVNYQLPIVVGGLLMVDNEKQAHERLDGKKGRRAAEAIDIAYEVVSVVKQLRGE
ncbi:MAG: 6,7-dimethyl-8-ribityllumazine synthase [Pseudomonadota bacterium]